MILLDTHAWLWWVNEVPNTLSPAIVETIERSETEVGVASISCLEVALLVKKSRIGLPCDLNRWFALALGESKIALLPLTPDIASRSAALPDIHKDPADRLIVATALTYNATPVTADEAIKQYPGITFAS